MRRTESKPLVLVAAALVLSAATGASAQDPQRPYPPELYAPQQPAAQQPVVQQPAVQQDFQPFTADQLDNLVAPIALYADPLLAQVLLAATFPDEIADAAKYVRTNGTDGIDDQPWDVSVKAVAHYPTVLNMMDTKSDWTTSLGQAYAAQSSEVMQAVQRMRRMAQAQGNLVSSPEQEVLVEPDYIRIWPASPRYIYVPVYDPAVVYVRPVFVRPGFHAFFSFGLPFRIGPWLIYDFMWPSWRIYYTGWMGDGWIGRSRPFVAITNIYYVNPLHRRVWFGRDVLRRHPDYGRIYRYDAIHPGIRYRGDDGTRRGAPRTGDPSQPNRRAMPRGNAGGVTTPRPVPMDTRAGEPSARVPVESRPGIERPRAAPVPDRPAVELPCSAPVERQPAVERPRPAPVERQPTIERPRPAPVPTPPPDVPRWTPVQRQPTVERPMPTYESRPAPSYDSRPQPQVERPRAVPSYEPRPQPQPERPRAVPSYQPRPQPQPERPRAMPSYQPPSQPSYQPRPQPQVERPRVESRQQPRAESRPQVQRAPDRPAQEQRREH